MCNSCPMPSWDYDPAPQPDTSPEPPIDSCPHCGLAIYGSDFAFDEKAGWFLVIDKCDVCGLGVEWDGSKVVAA